MLDTEERAADRLDRFRATALDQDAPPCDLVLPVSELPLPGRDPRGLEICLAEMDADDAGLLAENGKRRPREPRSQLLLATLPRAEPHRRHRAPSPPPETQRDPARRPV